MHRLAVLAVLGLLLTPAVAGAEGPWGETRLPGTCLALRKAVSAGAAGERLDAGCLLDVIRAIHNTTDGTAALPRLGRYLSAMGVLATELRAWPNGVRLPDAKTPRKDRDAVRDLCEHLGLRLRERNNVYTVEPDDSSDARERASWLEANGIRLPEVIESLNARRATPIVLSELSVRLPLPDVWARDLTDRDRLLAAQIVGDRQWALLYYGLMALDDHTLTYLAQRQALLQYFRTARPGVFASLGRSIRVRDGKVLVPGGAPALPAWTTLVGETPDDPGPFIRALLDRDEGRLAYFYDLAAHLDPPRRAFLLGLDGDAGGAAQRARDIYARFPETPTWKIDERPFFRPQFDASLALSFVDVTAGHTIGPTWWPSVFERIADEGDWPSRPDRVTSALRDRPADARWLLEWLFASPDDAPERFRWLRFAQRLLPGAPRSSAFAVETAIRTMKDLPALALSLERMGVTDPELITDLGRAARRLTQGGDAMPAVARWQASLALVEQIQRRRPLPAATMSDLLRGLIATVPDEHDQSAGAMAAWVAEVLVPKVLSAPEESTDLERSAIEAFAGNPASPAAKISWEGLDYVVGDAAPIVRQVLAIRMGQQLPQLQDLKALNDIRRRLEKGPTSLAEVTAIVADLTALQAAVAKLPAVDGEPAAIVRDYARAVSDLAKIKKPGDLPRAARELPVIGRTLDGLHDAIIAPLVYALAVAPSDQPLQTFAKAWGSHSFISAGAADRRDWTAIAWQPARTDVRKGGGLLVRGAYFALDVTLIEQRLPIVAPAGAGVVPRITGEDRQALVASISLTDATADTSGAAAVLGAIAKGRAEIARWQTQPFATETLRNALEKALVDEWRINLILEIAERSPATAFATLRMTEIWRLGGGTEAPGVFGMPATALDGCLCRRREISRGIEDLRSRVGPQAAAVAPDFMMRIGEQLERQKLPAGLSGMLLPIGVATWIAAVHQVDPSDWESLALPAARTDLDQLETALLHLVALGVLAPPGSGGGPRP